jgi:dTDP-4-amino-4,6-dideoxygalactose transaminase
VAERTANQILRLPLHPSLTGDELTRVVAAVTEFVPGDPVDRR